MYKVAMILGFEDRKTKESRIPDPESGTVEVSLEGDNLTKEELKKVQEAAKKFLSIVEELSE